jgi:hypothetical protein
VSHCIVLSFHSHSNSCVPTWRDGWISSETHNTYLQHVVHCVLTVRHAVTLKWLPIVFLSLIQSHTMYSYGYGKIQYGYSTTTHLMYFFPPIRNPLYYSQYNKILTWEFFLNNNMRSNAIWAVARGESPVALHFHCVAHYLI